MKSQKNAVHLKWLKQKRWTQWQYWIAFGFGTGLLPLIPGTWGTLPGVLFYYFLAQQSVGIYCLTVVLFFILGVYVAQKVTNDLGVHDHSGIVWDEIVGYLVTMSFMPMDWRWMILGFILFRLFDIWKPGPIRWIDQSIQGGLGIMLDDVAAAIPACLMLHGIHYAL